MIILEAVVYSAVELYWVILTRVPFAWLTIFTSVREGYITETPLCFISLWRRCSLLA